MSDKQDKFISKRRRPRRIVLWSGLALIVAMVAVITLLPLLVPEKTICDAVAGAIGDKLAREVKIDAARWRWSEGITCRGLAVARKEEFGPGTLLKAEEVNIVIQPWQLLGLLWKQAPTVDSVSLRGVEVHLVRNEVGRWNFAGASSPQVGLLAITQAQVYIEDQRQKTRVILSDVSVTTALFSEDESRYLNIIGAFEQAGRPAKFRLDLSCDRFFTEQLDKATGSFRVEWGGVEIDRVWHLARALSSDLGLPEDFWRGRWQGTVSGSADISFAPGGALAASGAISAADAGWQASGTEARGRDEAGQQIFFDRADVGFDLRYLPAASQLVIPTMSVSGGGVNLRASARCVLREKTPQFVVKIEEGAVSWDEFKRAVPAAEERPFDALAGRSAFSGTFRKIGSQVSVSGTVDFEDTELTKEGVIEKPRRVPARFEFISALDLASRKLSLPEAKFTSDVAEVAFAGKLALPTLKSASDVLKSAEVKGSGRVPDVGRLAKFLPFLAGKGMGLSGSGPLEFAFALEPAEDSLAASVNFDATEMKVALEDEVIKASGVTCKGGGKFIVPPEANRIGIEDFELILANSAVCASGAVDWPPSEEEEIKFTGNLRLTGLGGLLKFLPTHLRLPENVRIDGDVVVTDAAGKVDGKSLSITAALDATAASVRLGRAFKKSSGTAATCKFGLQTGFALDRPFALSADEIHLGNIKGKVGVGAEQLTANKFLWEGILLPQRFALDADLSTEGLASLPAFSPAVAEIMKQNNVELDGPASLVVAVARNSDSLRTSAGMDLTGARIFVKGLLDKSAGVEQRVELELETKGHSETEVNIKRFRVTLGSSSLDVNGAVAFTPALVGDGKCDSLLGAVNSSDITAIAVVACGESGRGGQFEKMCPAFANLTGDVRLDGPAQATLKWTRSGLKDRIGISLNADDAAVRLGDELLKSSGAGGRLEVDLSTGDVPGQVVLHRADLEIADGKLHADGLLDFVPASPFGLENLTGFTLKAHGKSVDLRPFASLSAGLGKFVLGGGMDFDLALSRSRLRTDLDACRFDFDDVRLKFKDQPVAVDGLLAVASDRLIAEALCFSLGETKLQIAADIKAASQAPVGTVHVGGPKADLNALAEFITALMEVAKAEEGPAGIDHGPSSGRFLKVLKNAKIRGDVKFDELGFAVAEWDAKYSLRGFDAQWALSRGRLNVTNFQCELNEGKVRGQAAADLAKDGLPIYVIYTAENLKVADNLQPLITESFPGLEVTGTLSQSRRFIQNLFPAEGQSPYPVGFGETVFYDGSLEGQAAPDYIAKLFPGLEFTKYDFKKMVNRFVNLSDGVTDNRMIFDGKTYDIFIFGEVQADGRVECTLGVDLAVSLGAKSWRYDLDPAKVPLMVYTGKIKGGKWVDQNVRFRYAHEVAYDVLIRRNLFLKLLRSLGEREGPDLTKPPYSLPEDL